MPSVTSTDVPKINLFYHPQCRASAKLMQLINSNSDAIKLFNFIDISSLNVIPRNIQKIPCIELETNIVHGKQCFDSVSRLISGPTSCNVFSTGSKICSFDNSNQEEYQICPTFSPLDDGNNMDGFKGVPEYTGENKRALLDR